MHTTLAQCTNIHRCGHNKSIATEKKCCSPEQPDLRISSALVSVQLTTLFIFNNVVSKMMTNMFDLTAYFKRVFFLQLLTH